MTTPAPKTFRHVSPTREPDEWTRIWALLAAEPANKGAGSEAVNSVSGEFWHYMGTADNWHEFRHRDHPVTHRRMVIRIPVVLA